jgi:hypothetical protein
MFLKRIPDEGPMVHIRPMAPGQMVLNAKATRLLDSRAIQRVRLIWDADTRLLVLREAPRDDGEAHKLTYGRSRSSIHIAARVFLREMNTRRPHKTAVVWNEQLRQLEAIVPGDAAAAAQ